MLKLGNVERTRAKVLGALHRLGRQVGEREASVRVGNVLDRVHQRSSRSAIQSNVDASHPLNKCSL